MINAKLIKEEKRTIYAIETGNPLQPRLEFFELKQACSALAGSYYDVPVGTSIREKTRLNTKRYFLAHRLEREFLRGEEEAISNDSEVVILVRYACAELDVITIINIKANTSNFYSLKHLYPDLLCINRDKVLFKEIGNYELKGNLGLNQYGVEIWDFEVIGFKPLGGGE